MVTFKPSSYLEEVRVRVPLNDDDINEAEEGFLLLVKVDEARSDPNDLKKVQYIYGGTTLILISDNDGRLSKKTMVDFNATTVHYQINLLT